MECLDRLHKNLDRNVVVNQFLRLMDALSGEVILPFLFLTLFQIRVNS